MRGRVALLIGLLLAIAILHRSSISRQAGRGIRVWCDWILTPLDLTLIELAY